MFDVDAEYEGRFPGRCKLGQNNEEKRGQVVQARSIQVLTTRSFIVLVFTTLARLVELKSPLRPLMVTFSRLSLTRTLVKRTSHSLFVKVSTE